VPQKGQIRVQHNTGAVGTLTPGTQVTTGAASGTKGSYAQMIASTSFDAYWLTIIASSYNLTAVDSQLCIDIAIGSATQHIIIADLLGGACGTANVTQKGPKQWDFPLYIPAGSELSARGAGARTSTTFRVACYLYGGTGYPNYRCGSKVVTYGVSSPPNGTTVGAGASGAAAVFTQITASTTEDHFALVPSIQVGADTVWVQGNLTVGFGIGAATEAIIGEGYWYWKDTGESMSGPHPSMPTFQDIPSGSRLTMSVANSGANDASYNAAIHALS